MQLEVLLILSSSLHKHPSGTFIFKSVMLNNEPYRKALPNIIISAVKRLIAYKIKVFVYFVYIKTHTYTYIIHIIDIIYKYI